MAEPVVDLLEVIKIEDQEADPPSCPFGLIQCLQQALLKEPAVGQPRQLIVICRPAQALLRGLPFVDVFQCAVPLDDRAILSEPRRGSGSEPTIVPIDQAHSVFGVEGLAT